MQEVKWTATMVRVLFTLKFVTNKAYFENALNHKKLGDGWNKVLFGMQQEYNHEFSFKQIKSKYQHLPKKLWDNRPHGKETTKTGNKPINASNCMDEEYKIMSEFFSKQPVICADLGQYY